MTTIPLSPVATRFAWKEFRTLRGFWIAAFVLGTLVEWFFLAVHARPPEVGWPTTLFIVALVTSALYAIGVAATTFSMEHEDETYSFLTGLPVRWLPIFAGKMWFALASALALAVALTIVGCLATGGQLPSLNDAAFALGSFGFLIVEAIVWGTFFSLLLRQPLLSALLAIAAVSASLSLLTTSFVEGHLSSLNAGSYVAVLPQRILLAAGIFLADVLLARNWLVLERRARRSSASDSEGNETAGRRARAWARLRARVRPALVRNSRLRMLGHLVWQSVRQSWRWMLGMPAVGILLCSVLYVVSYGMRLHILRAEDQMTIGPFLILLVVGGLYACGVFMADQRGRSYRFLAEHAALPRMIWLSRLFVWILPVVILLSLGVKVIWTLALESQFEWQRAFVNMWRGSEWPGDRYLFLQWQESGLFLRSFHFALWGVATGLALGQACSMFFRRALVAGLALGFATIPFVLLASLFWIWELPPSYFFLPIILGLLLATWFRAPDWLTERNTLRAWSKVLLAIVLPLLYLTWSIPAARELPANANSVMLVQIVDSLGAKWSGPWNKPLWARDVRPIVDKWVEESEVLNNADHQKTADRLEYLAQSATNTSHWIGQLNHQQRRSRPERAAAIRKAVDANRKIIDEAARLARQDYHFPIVWNADPRAMTIVRRRLWDLVALLNGAGEIATDDEHLDEALNCLLAGLTLEKRLRESQHEIDPLQTWRLSTWAEAGGQTSARIKAAIAALDQINPEMSDDDAEEKFSASGMASMTDWSPPTFLIANYLALRKIVVQPEEIITQGSTWREFAIVHLGGLPFERERALTILADLFADQTAQWYHAVRLTNQPRLLQRASITQAPRDDRAFEDTPRQLRDLVLRANEAQYLVDVPDYNSPPLSWMRTSLLLRRAYESTFGRFSWLQGFVNSRVEAWGVRLQLALIAYRIDHHEYPESLDALVPNYLPFVPIDPYSGRPFEYRPHGLDLGYQRDNHPEGTPLLWSVGAANFRLVRRTNIEPHPNHEDPGKELIEIRRDVYELAPSYHLMYLPVPQIFWLPK
jgi:ABC-type transport system involved in multi-copper enzyme maturation permease subunit